MSYLKNFFSGFFLTIFSITAIANQCQLQEPDLHITFDNDLPIVSLKNTEYTHIEFADMTLQLTKGDLSTEDSLMFLSVLSEYYIAHFESTQLKLLVGKKHSMDFEIYITPYFKDLLKDKDCANSVITALSKSPYFASS